MDNTKSVETSDIVQFEKLYKKYYKKALNYAFQYIRDIETSKGIVQESFINLWKKRKYINHYNNTEYYILTIVRNLSLNYLRDKARKTKRIGEVVNIDDNINIIALSYTNTDNTSYIEIQHIIRDTIENLPPKIKDTFLLSRDKKLTNKEIAEKENISIKTIEYRISKALIKLKLNLADYLSAIFVIIFLG
ncbi:MAG: RNA polymerase sigma-70 factor [Bacteroidales bacterium]|jgi:RNA polymerase sigma-70 factor (ECF subfamily)